MTYHPKQVHWFEAELRRDQSVLALETLVNTGSVQLEEKGDHTSPYVNIEILREHLDKCDQLIHRYASDLPADDTPPAKHLGDPEIVAKSALKTIQLWASKLLEMKRHIRQSEVESGFVHLDTGRVRSW